MSEEEKSSSENSGENQETTSSEPAKDAPGKLGRLGSTFSSAVNKGKDAVLGSSKKMADLTGKAMGASKDAVLGGSKKVVDLTGKAVGTGKDVVVGSTKKVVDVTGGVIKGGGKLTYSVVKGTFYVGGKAVSMASVVKDKAIREQFGLQMIRQTLKENSPKIKQEIFESKEMTLLMWKFTRGKGLTDEEKVKVTDQLKDLCRVVPALGIFALPGGAVLLPLIAKALPWSLLPSAFREELIAATENGEEEVKAFDAEVEKCKQDTENPLVEGEPGEIITPDVEKNPKEDKEKPSE